MVRSALCHIFSFSKMNNPNSFLEPKSSMNYVRHPSPHLSEETKTQIQEFLKLNRFEMDKAYRQSRECLLRQNRVLVLKVVEEVSRYVSENEKTFTRSGAQAIADDVIKKWCEQPQRKDECFYRSFNIIVGYRDMHGFSYDTKSINDDFPLHVIVSHHYKTRSSKT